MKIVITTRMKLTLLLVEVKIKNPSDGVID